MSVQGCLGVTTERAESYRKTLVHLHSANSKLSFAKPHWKCYFAQLVVDLLTLELGVELARSEVSFGRRSSLHCLSQ